MYKRVTDIIPVVKLHLDALIRTRSEKDLYDKAKTLAAVRNAIPVETIDEDYPPHPWHDFSMHQNRRRISEFASSPLRERHPTIGIHDSLIALRAEQCTAVDLPCGISGLGGRQYIRVIDDVDKVLKQYKIQPGFVVLGCIVGNMLLNRYSWGQCEREFLDVYSHTRKTYPDAAIILYGLPPVWDAYTTSHTWRAEELMIRTMTADVTAGHKAVFVSLKRLSRFGLFPRSKLSSDGVHLSDRGFIRFDRMLNEAHRSAPGSIIS